METFGESSQMSSKLIWLAVLACILAVANCESSEEPSPTQFEAFYPRQSHGVPNGAARPSHGHGSFYKHRNPALIDVKNPGAYGYRFDGVRRFNFD